MRAMRDMRVPRIASAVGGVLLITGASLMLVPSGGAADAAPGARQAIAGRTARHRLKHKHKHHHRHRKSKSLITERMSPAVASWYDDAGDTACGFHAQYGVANLTLPCGTRVRLRYGDHSVVATVDDRGPYVPGRTFDLDQATAGALGMWGVATIYSAVI